MNRDKERKNLVQIILKTAGHYTGKLDGIWGIRTQNGIFAMYPQLNAPKWINKRITAFLQLQANKRLALDIKVDGRWGQVTEYAYRRLRHLVLTGKNLPEQARPDERECANVKAQISQPMQVRQQWPKFGTDEFISLFGQKGENIVRMAFPYDMYYLGKKRVTHTRVNKAVKDAFLRIFTNILEHYGIEEIKRLGLDQFSGCYNDRKRTGGNEWSTHAWGIAIDMDHENNKFTWPYKKARFSGPEYNAFWRIIEAEGMISLGRALDFDTMHWQACRP